MMRVFLLYPDWWLLSPIIGFIVTYGIYKIIHKSIINKLNGFKDFERTEQIFSYIILAVIAITAFSRAGIPGFFSRGTVRPDPAGRAMLVLLACADEGLTASRFAEFLSLGQMPESMPEKPPEVQWVAPSSENQMVFKLANTFFHVS